MSDLTLAVDKIEQQLAALKRDIADKEAGHRYSRLKIEKERETLRERVKELEALTERQVKRTGELTGQVDGLMKENAALKAKQLSPEIIGRIKDQIRLESNTEFQELRWASKSRYLLEDILEAVAEQGDKQ